MPKFQFVAVGLLSFFAGCAPDIQTGMTPNLPNQNPATKVPQASPQSSHALSFPDSPLPSSSSNSNNQERIENILNQGRAAFHSRNYQSAAEYFKQVLDIAPDHLIAKGNYAAAISYQGQIEAGLKIFLELEPIHPNKNSIIDNIASAYAYLGDCDLAGTYKAKIDQVLSTCPTSLPAHNHFNAGQNYFNQGKYEDARLEFSEALKILPNFIDARFNLAASLGALGKYQDALNSFLQVEASKPDYPGLTQQLALAYGYLGNCLKAAEYNARLGKNDVTCPLQVGFAIKHSTK